MSHHKHAKNHPATEAMQEWLAADVALPKTHPAVSIYGSARIPSNHSDYQQAEQLARKLSDAGFAVISGGGPGIMEAANKGAFAGASQAVGLNIVLPHEQHPNPYQNLSLKFQHFTSRKTAFVQHSAAFIVFAGGFGTLDELFETLVLIQTGKLPMRPVILVGRTFWQGLLDWIEEQLVARNLIASGDMNLLQIIDDAEEIVRVIQNSMKAA
ncbi:TIGR00730 family Rossman fold protein [Wielerella bovis]|uniref:LOG family protein n=1 Tax=Wielerella bovis TaxID=2917790 RepID=UPI003D289C6E